MKILAFDTSTSSASVALWEEQRCVALLTCEMGRRHSERLFDVFATVLDLAGWTQDQLEAYAVGLGPGSFTGLRVGVATAHGLAFAGGKPLFGVNSLDALVYGAPAGPEWAVAMVDARKKELYVGTYRRQRGAAPGWQPAGGPRLLKPEALVQELRARGEPALLLGSGALAYGALWQEQLAELAVLPVHQGYHVVHASHIAYLAMGQAEAGAAPAIHEVLPIYIRPSEAEMFIGPPEGGPPLEGRLTPEGEVLPAHEEREAK